MCVHVLSSLSRRRLRDGVGCSRLLDNIHLKAQKNSGVGGMDGKVVDTESRL